MERNVVLLRDRSELTIDVAGRSGVRKRGTPAETVAEGARARVEVVVRREAPSLLAYFTRRVLPVEDAADLLSETLLVVWRRADVMPADDEQVRMWLFGIARNVLSTHRRGQQRRSALADQLRDEIATSRSPSAVDGRCADDRVELVRDLIRQLPSPDREIFMLVHWDGFTLAETALHLGMRAGTVRSRYSRARAVLRTQLDRSTG